MNIVGSLRQRRKTPRLDDRFGKWKKSPARPGSDACGYSFLALQPILNRRREVFGYEALSRSGWDNWFTGDSDAATKMMVDEWMFHGIDELTGGRRTFLNCTREALVRGAWKFLPSSTVLELLETVEPDDEVLIACRSMKRLGYKIALDDFQHSEKMQGLIDLADYVKVDFRLSGKEERSEIIRRLKSSASILVAEKIETQEEFEMARREGFRLFQGYYLGRPEVFSKCRVSGDHVNPLLRLPALS